MNVEFINPFLASFIDVMSTMAMVPVQPDKPKLKADARAAGVLTGFIEMKGPQVQGSLAISFDRPLIEAVFTNMLGEPEADLDKELRDLVGEITNMLTGGAKMRLAEKGYDFELAQPKIIDGEEHYIMHFSPQRVICIPIAGEAGKAMLEISFNK
ncbi:chemotaxis protein CheX [Salinibius halmophilus]|uniref:chemotaxis protein CheX n=1 Tax=Salinibius halmophilus TaxID=1853216 RepID=UPI000E67614A|nr:chemotaxis protein CheX [Salinibius halmophilus]